MEGMLCATLATSAASQDTRKGVRRNDSAEL